MSMAKPVSSQRRQWIAAAERDAGSMSRDQFLSNIQSPNADTRFAAWIQAGKQAPDVIDPLGKLLESKQPGVVKAASAALEQLAHSVGKTTGTPRRKEVTNQLRALLKQDSKKIRVFALRCLSLIAEEDTIPAIAPLLKNPELFEEAIYCLERTPGQAADQAIIQVLDEVPDYQKIRVMAALGHRQVEAASVAIGKNLASPNKDVAIAAMKAIARIGLKPDDVSPPDPKFFSPWQQTEAIDSMFRYAEKQAQKGNVEEEFAFYKIVLTDKENGHIEEHHRCAAVQGLARLPQSEAFDVMLAGLEDKSYIVRTTTMNLLASLPGELVDNRLKAALSKSEGLRKEALDAVIKQRAKK